MKRTIGIMLASILVASAVAGPAVADQWWGQNFAPSGIASGFYWPYSGSDRHATHRFTAPKDMTVASAMFRFAGSVTAGTITLSIMGDDGTGLPDNTNILAQNDWDLPAAGYHDVPLGTSVNLTAGTVYHAVITYGTAAFRLYETYDAKDFGPETRPKYNTLYGMADPMIGTMACTSWGAWRNGYENTAGPEPSNPRFQLFDGGGACVFSQWAHGAGTGNVTDATTERGERFVLQDVPADHRANDAVRVGALRIWARKSDPAPDADLKVTLQDEAGTEIASGTVAEGDVGTTYGWAEAAVTHPVQGKDLVLWTGQTYKVIASSPGLTSESYTVMTLNYSDSGLPTVSGSFYGAEAYYDGTTTDTTKDVPFGLYVKPMLPGDANLDDLVNVGDLGILGGNYRQTGKDWYTGDFNGDGLVNVADLGILGANYGKTLDEGAAVPEPATLTLLGLCAAGLLRRRRPRPAR